MDIWIIEQIQPCNLWDDLGQGRYLLVDTDALPLLDAQGKPYRYPSVARAEAQSYQLLRPYLENIARTHADRHYS